MNVCYVVFSAEKSCRCIAYSERRCFLFLAPPKHSSQDCLIALQQSTCKWTRRHVLYCNMTELEVNSSGWNTSLISALGLGTSDWSFSLELWRGRGRMLILQFIKTSKEEQQISLSVFVYLCVLSLYPPALAVSGCGIQFLHTHKRHRHKQIPGGNNNKRYFQQKHETFCSIGWFFTVNCSHTKLKTQKVAN